MSAPEPLTFDPRGNPVPRPAWLRMTREEAVEPELPVIDAHHHLFQIPYPYLFSDLLADLDESGHDVAATVYVDCRAMYRQDGPQSHRPIGEVEFANGVGAMAASGAFGTTRVAAAIVGHVDLDLGEGVVPVLEEMMRVAPLRFRGIRHGTGRDPAVHLGAPESLMLLPEFQRGFGCLQDMGLSFDAWVYHPQLPELLRLMRAFPDARVVLNHAGGRIGIGPYAGRPDEEKARWRTALAELSRYPNVFVKLGGLGMKLWGFDLFDRSRPVGSEELAGLWEDDIAAAIDMFGAERCMFESNYPVDKASVGYGVLWNAFKKVSQRYGAAERRMLLCGTAARVYAISLEA